MFKGRHFDQSVILLCVRWYLLTISACPIWRKLHQGSRSLDVSVPSHRQRW